MPDVTSPTSIKEQSRKFFATKHGRTVGALLALVGLALIALLVRSAFGPSGAAAATRERLFICSESGKSFPITVDRSTRIPSPSPYSGKNTGYPAELCYWTRDGQIKSDPTPVLLNHWIGKAEPTFCPDCGRLVVMHNPFAFEGNRPPPTEEEYKAAHESD